MKQCGMRRRLFAVQRIEGGTIDQIDVEPAIVVVIEEGNAAAFGFNDGSFVIDAAPDVGDCQTSLLT
jgi:hypothetical protein